MYFRVIFCNTHQTRCKTEHLILAQCIFWRIKFSGYTRNAFRLAQEHVNDTKIFSKQTLSQKCSNKSDFVEGKAANIVL